MLYLVIFIFLLLIIIILMLYFFKGRVIIELVKNKHDDRFFINISAFWGMIDYEYETPVFGSDRAKKIKKKKFFKKESGEEKKQQDDRSIFEKIKSSIDLYRDNKEIICILKNYISKRFLIEEYRLKAEAGTGDAFQTGILSGVLWTVTGVITSFILDNFKTLKSHTDIKPVFSEERLYIDFYCIISAKNVHIIIVILLIYINNELKSWESEKKKDRWWFRWLNILLKV